MAALFKAGDRILTHCNAGALATAGYGTALGVIRSAAARYPDVSVWVDETRPWLQGARLTAWELQVEGIPYRLIADNMAGYFMRRGEVDGVVVGADRIAANGDTANKIGTLQRQRAGQGARHPVLRGRAALHRRPHDRGRRRDPDRGARPRRGHVLPRRAGRARGRRRPRTRRSTSRRPPTSPPSSPRPACCGRRSGRRWRRPAAAGSACRERAVARARVPHGRGSRHAPLPAHRAHVEAHGAHPQPSGHGAPAAPAAPPRSHRDSRQPALPPGEDPLLLRRRRRVRCRAAVQPRGAPAGHRRRRRRVPRVPLPTPRSSS